MGNCDTEELHFLSFYSLWSRSYIDDMLNAPATAAVHHAESKGGSVWQTIITAPVSSSGDRERFCWNDMGWGQTRSGSPHYGGKADSFIDSKIVATKWKQITDWNNRCGCINWVQCFYILFTLEADRGRSVSPLAEHELTSQRCLIKPPLMTPSKEHQLWTPSTLIWPQLLLTASVPPENASLGLQFRDDKPDQGPTPHPPVSTSLFVYERLCTSLTSHFWLCGVTRNSFRLITHSTQT